MGFVAGRGEVKDMFCPMFAGGEGVPNYWQRLCLSRQQARECYRVRCVSRLRRVDHA